MPHANMYRSWTWSVVTSEHVHCTAEFTCSSYVVTGLHHLIVTTHGCCSCFQRDKSWRAIQGFVAFNNLDKIFDHAPPFSSYDALRMELHTLHNKNVHGCRFKMDNSNTKKKICLFLFSIFINIKVGKERNSPI